RRLVCRPRHPVAQPQRRCAGRRSRIASRTPNTRSCNWRSIGQRRDDIPLASGDVVALVIVMNMAMNGDRFVVLGVAPARAPWFRTVSQWANAASLPVEFLKCLSPEEVRARLASGQPFSALLADAGVPAVDRDLVSAATR